jgi:RNA polymerase sigma-70 factor, ECF subfamily
MTEPNEQHDNQQAQSDPNLFLQLYEQYIDRIYAFAYRRTHDDPAARDITSATFEKVLRNLHRYQSRSISVSAWLYRIARNEVVNYYRQRWTFLPLHNQYPAKLNVERTVQAQQDQDALHIALSHLSQAEREVITLRYLDELSSTEVAEILGCSVDNLYVRLHRALGKLRKQLEKLEISEVIYAKE